MKEVRRLALLVLLFSSFTTGLWADAGFLDPADGVTFRVMSYNPYWDAIFSTGARRYDRSAEFLRVLSAVAPDIACLQEIDPHRDQSEILAIFNQVLPLPEGEQWTVVSGADNVIVSRFPILQSSGEVVAGRGARARGQVIALIDLPDHQFADNILVAAAHFPSGGSRSDINSRTEHADALVAAVRSAGRGHAEQTPVVLAGDFNAYGTDPRRHLDTLISGDIADESRYGEDLSLDPSGAPMIDLLPSHNAAGSDRWTWRDDTQQFEPYPLDRVIFTGSLLRAAHSFVLNTAAMPADDLTSRNLNAGDVALDLGSGDFDHLPLVVDFVQNR